MFLRTPLERRSGCRVRALALFAAALAGGLGVRSAGAGNPIAFGAPAKTTLSGYPHNLTAADLDSDGVVDLVVTHTGDLALLFGRGDGTFELGLDRNLGGQSEMGQVLAADLNGDALSDLVVCQSSSVSVLLNTGGRTFAPQAGYVTGATPIGVAASDFDGDGDADLAVTNHHGNSFRVLINSGDGSFALSTTYSLGAYPARIQPGDWNEDGRVDLVVSEYPGAVRAFVGDGAGQFSAGNAYSTRDGAAGIGVGDLNADGHADLLTCNVWSNCISVLLGDGTGRFAGPAFYGTSALPHIPQLADFDLDGDLDAAIPHADGSTFSVLTNNGAGAFGGEISFAAGQNVRHLAVGLLDGDQRPDVVTADYNDGTISIFLNQTTPAAVPAVPTDLAAVADAPTRVHLTWTDQSTDETAFEIERKAPGADFRPLATTSADIAVYDDTDVAPRTGYSYRVRAVNAIGRSAFTDPVRVVTPEAPPDAPSDLVVSWSKEAEELTFHWTDNSFNETRFRLEDSREGGGFALRAYFSANVTSAVVGLSPGNARYDFRLRAENAVGASDHATVSISVPPKAPNALSVRRGLGLDLALSWWDSNSGSVTYLVERSEDGGATWTQIAEETTHGYLDRNLRPLTTYSYRLSAANGGGISRPSLVASETTNPAPPTPPTQLTAEISRKHHVFLTWSDNSDNEEEFLIERLGPGGQQLTYHVDEGVNTFTDRRVEAGTTYTYRVRARNAGGNSDYTDPVQVTTPLAIAGRLVVPRRLDFGGVTVGGERRQALVVRNASKKERLRVEFVRISGPFHLMTEKHRLVLEPEGTTSFEVVFRPRKAGAAGGTFRLASSDPKKLAVNVRLKGRGLIPK
jgi:hypothetical protein